MRGMQVLQLVGVLSETSVVVYVAFLVLCRKDVNNDRSMLGDASDELCCNRWQVGRYSPDPS